ERSATRKRSRTSGARTRQVDIYLERSSRAHRCVHTKQRRAQACHPRNEMKLLAITVTLNPTSGWGRYARAVIHELEKQGIEFSVCSEDRADVSYKVTQLAALASKLPA